MIEKRIFSSFKTMIFLGLALLMGACSKDSATIPTPPLTKAELLVNGGKWITRGGTLVAADSSKLVLNINDPFFSTILLQDVTFFADGTAVEITDPNGLTKNGLTWQISGNHLLVHLNFNNTDKVDGDITYLSENKLVMEVSDFYLYNGVTYVKLIQTLTP